MRIRGSFCPGRRKKMQVEIYRLASKPVTPEVSDGATVKDVFSHPASGKAIGREGSLLDAAEEAYGSIEALGNIGVNGLSANLDSPVPAGATILVVPKVQGG